MIICGNDAKTNIVTTPLQLKREIQGPTERSDTWYERDISRGSLTPPYNPQSANWAVG